MRHLRMSESSKHPGSTSEQEVFGPYSLVVRCKDMNEMLEVANHIEGQLTATLMATEEDIRNSEPLAERTCGSSGGTTPLDCPKSTR